MKRIKKSLSLLLAGSMLLGIAGQAAAAQPTVTTLPDGRTQITLEFKDMQQAQWAIGHITRLQSQNVFQGFEDGTFRPNQAVTRVEAIVTTVRLMGLEQEAKAKPADAKLHFKDADVFNKKYAWAKGYVLTALEHGLFDTSEDLIQPDVPASRLWVSSLLVKSLGYEKEALQQMNTTPQFKDANAIPAGAVGYVNVAVKYNIISGYPDGTFQPNSPVTRAEMAVLLDRTNNGLLNNAGAVQIEGVVKSINYSGNTVTDPVYNIKTDGTIVIETASKELKTYSINSKLPVQYVNKYIYADQLTVNDQVKLVVRDHLVVQAQLVNATGQPGNGTNPSVNYQISELELEVELQDGSEVKLEYKVKNDKVNAEVEKKSGKSKTKLVGNEAKAYIEKILQQANLSDSMSKEDALKALLTALGVDQNKLDELELKVKFTSGKSIKVEIDNDDDDHKHGNGRK